MEIDLFAGLPVKDYQAALDHDGFVAAAGSRGLEPTTRETYENGVRKTTYHDPEGNEIGIGGAPHD